MAEKLIQRDYGPYQIAGVFNYDLLRAFDWLPDYFKCVSLRAEVESLRHERNRIGRAPLPKKLKLEKMEVFFQAYRKRRQEILKNYFAEWQGGSDPFLRFGPCLRLKTRTVDLPPALDWSEIEAVFREIPDDPTAMSVEAKEKLTAKLDREIADLERELEAVFPPQYRALNGSDMREALVGFWIDTQKRCSEPCGLIGIKLEDCSNAEIAAWKKLKLGDFINLKTGLLPAD